MKVSLREQEVLKLIAYEHTSKEIAQQLFISKHTAISHRQNLMEKFGAKNTAGLVRRAFELGYLKVAPVIRPQMTLSHLLPQILRTASCFLILFLIAGEVPEVRGQVLNDEINIHTTTRSFKRNEYWSNSEDGTMETRWLLDSKNGAPYTLAGNERFFDTHANGYWGVHLTEKLYVDTMVIAENLPFDALQNVIYVAWEDDDAGTITQGQVNPHPPAFYPLNHGDEINSNRQGTYSFRVREDGEVPGIWKIRTPTQALLSHHHPTHLRDDMSFWTTWRYNNGDHALSPLDFGVVSNGSKSHVNRTASNPTAASSISYNNVSDWYGTSNQPSSDVFYEFQITESMKRVVLSTDHGETDFDTYMHLYWWPGSGNVRKIESNDDISTSPVNRQSAITRDLCPGSYYVIVEGFGAATGTFKLSVDVSTPPTSALHPGGITNFNSEVCQNSAIPTIVSDFPPFVLNGDVGNSDNPAPTYLWQKKVGNNAYTLINAETSASLSNTGTMGTEDVIFRRQANYCGIISGWAYDTIRYLEGSADGGTMSLQGSATIPEGFDPGQFLSDTSATTDPAPPTYQWQSSTNNISYADIDGATDSSYDPGNVSLTTWYRRVASNACGSQSANSNIVKVTVIPANGAITGYVTAPGLNAVGIKGVQVCAVPRDTTTVDHLMTVCDSTDEDGLFEIKDIYYGGELTRWDVTATLDDHDIRVSNIADADTSHSILLSSSNPEVTIGFVDRTVFSVTGNVFQDFTQSGNTTSHGLNRVVIYLDSLAVDTTSHTGDSTNWGDYGLIVPNAGTYTLRPEMIDPATGVQHGFIPAERTLVVNSNVADVNFKDTTTMNLVGYIGASCNRELGGSIKHRIYQDPMDGGFEAEFDLRDEISLTLPARPYLVEITEQQYLGLSTAYESADVKKQLTDKFSYTTDMSFASDSSMFIYYRPPVEVVLSGIPGLTSCEGGISIMEQGVAYPDFKIKVWEGPASDGCELDTGAVVISADAFTTTVPVINGDAQFLLYGGQPVQQAPHTAAVSVLAKNFISDKSDTETFNILTTGKQAIGKRFITVSPEIPFLILHDPPGDLSYSYMIEDTTYETAFRTSVKDVDQKAGWEYTQLGAAYSIGIAAGPVSESIDFAANINDDETISITRNDATLTEQILSWTASTEYKTSDLEDATVIGDRGDLYFGYALNFITSNTFTLAYDTSLCDAQIDNGVLISPDSIQTTFAMTGHQVENDIAALNRLANLKPDSSWYFLRQAKIWEDMLADNAATKARAIQNADRLLMSNQTFPTGGGIVKRSITTSESNSNTIEFLLELDTALNKGMRYEVAGNGQSSNNLTRVKVETGESDFNVGLKSKTFGYALGDTDSDDKFTVDIYEDPVYGSPLFVTRASETSCPYEVGSTPIDLFQVTKDPAFPSAVTDIPSEQGVTFGLRIANNGNFTRIYEVRNDVAYSQGAIVEVGNQASGTVFAVAIAPGKTQNIQVVVRRNTAVNNSEYGFPRIRIIVEPECQGLFYQQVLSQHVDFSVDFRSTCSPITLVDPIDGRIVNGLNNNLLPVEMANYDVTKIQTVTLQYAEMGTGDWKSSAQIVYDSIDLVGFPSKRENWILNEVPDDGKYEIRLKVVCPIGNVTYSLIHGITIDREGPTVYGIPEPIDDIYEQSENDQISITYTEVIACTGQTEALLIDLISGDTLTTTVSCLPFKVVITPSEILDNRTPSAYRVVLSGVTDVAGNVGRPNSWVFLVGEVDFQQLTCLPDLVIANNNDNQDAINVTVYRALSIRSNGVVPAFGTTSYKAQSDVQLDGGFAVNTGGVFEAQIENCVDE